MEKDNGHWLAFVGSDAKDNSGIHSYKVDRVTGAFSFLSATEGPDHPSFLALHPTRPVLYSVCRLREPDKHGCGGVRAYAITSKDGKLEFINQQSSMSDGPCHLEVDETGRFVLVANYSGGSVAMLPLREDGGLEKATGFVKHEGSSIHPGRQENPHPHSINVAPGNCFAFVPDLGTDRIMCYRMDLDQGVLMPHDPPSTQVKAGAGPRHLALHPSGRFAYLINELDSTLIAYALDVERGTLAELQTISTLPEGFEGENYCADVHVSPCGRYLYGSNRGHDSVAVYRIDEQKGILTSIETQATQGAWPRNFAVDPQGRFLWAANQNGDSIVGFRIESKSGKLEATGQTVKAQSPYCIKLYRYGAV